MLNSKVKKNRERVKAKRPTPIRIDSAAASGTVLTLTFNQPVVRKGTPQYETDVAGAVPTAAEMTDPMTMEVTFDADISLATSVTIPFEDPAVRNPRGGFVADSTFPLAA